MVAVDAEDMYAAEAAKRMKAGKPGDPTSNLDGGSGESIEQAAKSLGVSTSSAKRAKAVVRHDPELAEKVRAAGPSKTGPSAA